MINPKSNDLLLRKQENELPALWLSQSYLLALLPDLSEDYLRAKARPQYKASVQPCHHSKSFLPNSGKSWRWAKHNGSFFYDYDSIPDKQPACYASQLPSRNKLIELFKATQKEADEQPLESFIKPFLNDHYREFLPCYGDCSKQQQENLAKAAAALKAACEYFTTNNLSFNKNDFFKQFAAIQQAMQLPYTRKNYRRFKEQVELVILKDQPVTDIIKLPREDNQNASVHCEDAELASWIIQMRMMGENYTNAYMIRKLQYMCTITEKPMPSTRTIGHVLEQHNTNWLTAAGRYGAKGKHGRMYRGYIPLSNALYAGDCWQVDGTRVNLIDFKLNGKNVFLYIVAVRDVHSGDVLGYSFDLSENRWNVHAALKAAAEEAGYLPYQIIFDRFPGHNTPEMKALFADMENRGVKISFTHTATGKAKLERWFSTAQQVFMQESNYYYGEGVQSRNKFAHRSKETLKRMKAAATQDGWDFDKAVNEACKIIEAYRTTKLSYYSRKYKTIDKSPELLHTECEKPNVTILEEHQIVYLFGMRTKRKFEGEGLLTLQIQNYPFSYRCADPAVVSMHETVTICYNLEDISTIHLYEISDKPLKKYLGTAEEVSVQVYGPDGEWKKLQQQKTIIANMQQERMRQLGMKRVAGDDVTILLQGVVDKDDYEAAETNFLTNEWDDNEDTTGDYNIQDQYS